MINSTNQSRLVLIAGAIEEIPEVSLAVLYFEERLLEVVRTDQIATQPRVEARTVDLVDKLLVELPVPSQPEMDLSRASGDDGVHGPLQLCGSP